MKSSIETSFLNSALTLQNQFIDIPGILEWVSKRRHDVKVDVTRLRFDEMTDWEFDSGTGDIKHKSGKFFSIEGIRVKTNGTNISEWDQPIINQPEIGFLGIITKKFNNVLHFLMQTKIEPGNINYVQISPTLQATKSNYTKVHKGNTPHYLEYFNGDKMCKKHILLDQLQSEQGARFIKKRNRNIIIEVEDDVEAYEDFQWLTLGQIKELLTEENLVNMDTRTVISGIPFGQYQRKVSNVYRSLAGVHSDFSEYGIEFLISSIDSETYLYDTEEIISWITSLKCKYELEILPIGLKNVHDWYIEADRIRHKDDKYFTVFPVRAEIANREVKTWVQPIVESAQEGIIAFVVKKIKGVFHLLIQAKLEAGNFDIIELAPTVQCLTGNYKLVNKPPFLDYVLKAKPSEIIFDTYQSEEGGRFYREQNRNLIIVADENIELELPENYIWMTLNQINKFITFNNYINIQARSLLSAIKFI